MGRKRGGMNEEQTKHDKITPALKEAGWDRAPFKLALEQQVAPGRVEHDVFEAVCAFLNRVDWRWA